MSGPSTKSRIKYMHYDTLDKEDFLNMFTQALKHGAGIEALIEYFQENKDHKRMLEYIQENVH